MGCKRRNYRKQKSRRYPSQQKTTTSNGKREYQRNLMRVRLNISPSRFGVRGPKPQRFLLKNFAKDLAKLRLLRGR